MTSHTIHRRELVPALIGTVLALCLALAVIILTPTQCPADTLTIADLIEAINGSRLNSEVFYSDPE